MNLHSNDLFHIYNRGNNSQKIFYSQENYLFFLKKFRNAVEGKVDVLAYCLMPNHFHFLISTSENFNKVEFTNKWKVLLSSYTRAINIQESRTGSLFQQGTKSKDLNSSNQALVCFNYIHLNPIKAKLVSKIHDWSYSSFPDYCGLRNGTLVNRKLAHELLDIPIGVDSIDHFSKSLIPDNYRDVIF